MVNSETCVETHVIQGNFQPNPNKAQVRFAFAHSAAHLICSLPSCTFDCRAQIIGKILVPHSCSDAAKIQLIDSDFTSIPTFRKFKQCGQPRKWQRNWLARKSFGGRKWRDGQENGRTGLLKRLQVLPRERSIENTVRKRSMKATGPLPRAKEWNMTLE